MTKWLLYCFLMAPADQQLPQTNFELFSSHDACIQNMRATEKHGLDCMCMHHKSPVQVSPLDWEYEPAEADDVDTLGSFDAVLPDDIPLEPGQPSPFSFPLR